MWHQRIDSISPLRRHPKYYIRGADLHIVTHVQQTLFRVHGYFFSRESPIFNRMLNPASPGDRRQGVNDNDPIVLEDVSPEEFEKLLWVFYNPEYSLYKASVSDWNVILNLADRWDFNRIKELGVRELEKKPKLDIITKINIYQKYKVDKRHLVPLYAALCERDTPLTVDEMRIIGLETTALITTTREHLRALPCDGRSSPLRRCLSSMGLEEVDVFRALESQMGIEVGSTARFRQENDVASSADSPVGPESSPQVVLNSL